MNIVTDNLDQIINAPDGIKRLRELILQLAVQGKLVPQRPEDGSADELLRRIQEEKRKDAEQRKARGERIRKTKPLPAIGKDEVPFEIPKGWKWVPLELIANVGTGATPLVSNSAYYGGENNWVSSKSTNTEFITEPDKLITDKALQETNCTVNPVGTLVVAMYGQGKTRGQVSELMIEAATNQACASVSLILSEPAIRQYVKILFKKLYNEIRELASGGAQPNLNLSKIKETAVPLPPLMEQKRIVAKVDELMAWCDELDALKEKRTALRTAALKATLNQLVGTAVPAVRPPAAPAAKPAAKPTEQPTETASPCGALGEHALPLKSSAPPCLCVEKILPLITSPADVKQLRDAILQLAVQGRLVEQRDADGSAADLLQQIEEAKAADLQRRKANGERIRKTKPLPPITEEEIPYDIPENWEWVKIGTTMNMINGKAFKPADWASEGLPIVRIQNLNRPDAPFNLCGADVDPKFRISSGEFLISWSGTPGTSFGAFIWERGDAVLNQHIFKCELWGDAYLKAYMRLAINSRLDEMISHAHGAVGLRHITKGKLENMCITLPPLAEQQRIVAKVDELMGWCDELEALLQTESETAARFAAAAAKA